MAKADFGQCAECGFLASRDSLDPREQVIGNLNGCLRSMATHIRTDGPPFQAAIANAKVHRGPCFSAGFG
jgi:hypothetical protein